VQTAAVSGDLVVWMSGQPLWRPLAVYAEGVLMVRQRTSEGHDVLAGPGVGPRLTLVLSHRVRVEGADSGARARRDRRWTHRAQTANFAGLGSDATRRRRRRGERFTDFALALWCAIYLLMSVQSPLNIGFRHLFPALPFIYMLTAGAWRDWTPRAAWLKPGLVALLLVWFAGETASASPLFLSSFNEFGGGRSDGYRYATDSNFDWDRTCCACASSRTRIPRLTGSRWTTSEGRARIRIQKLDRRRALVLRARQSSGGGDSLARRFRERAPDRGAADDRRSRASSAG